MATLRQDLGPVTAYAFAVEKGYTGTEEEYAELMASYATVAEAAAGSASDAADSASDAEAYGAGTRGGNAVTDDDEAYHNNAKYYADQAADDASTVSSAVSTFTETTVPGAVQSVTDEGTRQIGLVQGEGTTQIGLVQAKGTEQVAAVQAKGTEVIGSIPQDYSDLSDDVSDLKSAISAITGNSLIDMINGYYIDLNESTADVNNPSPQSSTPWRYAVVECAEGDIFTLTAVGGVTPRAYGFVASNGTVLYATAANESVENAVITAPENSTYLVINDKGFAGDSYVGEILVDIVDSISDRVDDLANEIITEKPTGITANKASTALSEYGTNGYISYNKGNFTEASAYKTYTLVFDHDDEIYVDKIGTGLVTAVLYKSYVATIPTGTTAASAYYIKGSRSDKTGSEALPTSSAKWAVSAGNMLIVSLQNASTEGNDFTIHYNSYGTYLANDINLNIHQQEQVLEIVNGKKPSIKYGTVDTGIGSQGKEQVTVYLPATSGYIKYAFVRCESDAKNANIWRIDKCYACNEAKSVLYPITNSGEWEMAIKIDGREDFFGGIAHGDEVFTAFNVWIDGVKVSDITAMTTETEFEQLNIVELSDVYDPNDEVTLSTKSSFTPIGTHGREYIVTNDGIFLSQRLTLAVAETLAESYMTMLPIIRGNDSVSADQITDHYYDNRFYTIYDVSVGGSGDQYTWKNSVTRATIYGETSKVSATVDMIKQPDVENNGARRFKVQGTADLYNKLYWSICGVNNNNYSASANEAFVVESLYRINVG